ncbi:hypothetical protein VP01_789g1 [Puccinia sorghi]|uniref:Uncharacterized protein n=1 Tax=Puccinia sorghi TaxID=27349 RepID=A0A0L6UBR3_9BASI|nr:hypothetical protein VP01_789g1 [Puccinia sorghi]
MENKDLIYIFLSAFPRETCIKIKRELISNDKIKFSADGYCKSPAFSDLLEFTEREIKAASDDHFRYGRDFFVANRVMQQGIARRLRKWSKEFESSNSTEERPIGNAPPSRTLYEIRPMICFYCRKEGHGTAKKKSFFLQCGTQRCQELEAEQWEGLVQRIGKDYTMPNLM